MGWIVANKGVYGRTTFDELADELDTLWQPIFGPVFPKPHVEVLARYPTQQGSCPYFYDVVTWDGERWQFSGIDLRPVADLRWQWRPIL